ncbi:hypothetical protein KP509_08G052800 [Ceratopteris richardii]|uniref:Uncharacterized protein n=1 Tax=Ceratopteris richardii TaxID=49495 RepID=A0A8T2UE03_CERRI|nr:hypothetical protein KP509_08G052800 [Ceratopteris richardii]
MSSSTRSCTVTREEDSTTHSPPFDDWLAPRISNEFVESSSSSVSRKTTREISEVADSPARLSSSKSSPSEFEFSMTLQGSDTPLEGTMVAADELFADGKLRPLYYTSTGVGSSEPPVSRRRSSAEDHVMNARFREVDSVGVAKNPISPKAPTCTSRWREFLGLKKAQIQDTNHGSKVHRSSCYPGSGLISARRSVDSLKDRNGSLQHSEVRSFHYSGELKPFFLKERNGFLQHGSVRRNQNSGELKICSEQLNGSIKANQSQADPSCRIFDQERAVGSQCSRKLIEAGDVLLRNRDPELWPTSDLQKWQGSRPLAGKRASDCSDALNKVVMEVPSSQFKHESGHPSPRKSGSRSQSPSKRAEQPWSNAIGASHMRAGAGSRGMSPARTTAVHKTMENPRSAMSTRLVVRQLDRSHSSSQAGKNRPDQLKSCRQRSFREGSMTMERSTSYSTGVKVAPVLNVPMYITPGLRKRSGSGIFRVSYLFRSNKHSGHGSKNTSSSNQL